MNHLFSIILVFFLFELHAQPFQPDEFGYVHGTKFRKFISKRGYQLVGSFFTVKIDGKLTPVAEVLKGKDWIFIDANGKELGDYGELSNLCQILDFENPKDYSIRPSKKLKSIKKDNKFGVVNEQGAEVLPIIYSGVDIRNEGYILVCSTRNGERFYGMADSNGKLIIDTIYSSIGNFTQNMIRFYHSNSTNSPSTDAIFDLREGDFVNYLVKYQMTEHPFYCNPNGRKIYTYQNQDTLFGWIGLNGKILVEAQYQELESSNNDPFLVVKKENRYGVIDTSGKVFIPFKYEKLEQFSFDVFETEHLHGCLAMQVVSEKRGDVFVITENGKQGVIDIHEQLLIPLKYESVQPTADGMICKNGTKIQILNLKGQICFQTTSLIIDKDHIDSGLIHNGDFKYDLYGNKLKVGRQMGTPF